MIPVYYELLIYMKTFLDSDWLKECNFIEIQCQKRNIWQAPKQQKTFCSSLDLYSLNCCVIQISDQIIYFASEHEFARENTCCYLLMQKYTEANSQLVNNHFNFERKPILNEKQAL